MVRLLPEHRHITLMRAEGDSDSDQARSAEVLDWCDVGG